MYATVPVVPAASRWETAPTIVEVLRRRAAIEPSTRAYVFLTDSGAEMSIDCSELDRAARRVAGSLRPRAAAGDRVLLVYAAGLDYLCGLFGCLYAGIVGVPLALPHSSAQMDRLASVARDADAEIVLTTGALSRNLRRRFSSTGGMDALEWLATDALREEEQEAPRSGALDGESLAYLQYTSGSTGTPRGVMIRHRQLVHNMRYLDEGGAPTRESVVVTWLPHFHDMGLVCGLLTPFYVGCECVFMSPMTFIQRPIRWLSAISHYRGTHTMAPNFAYDLCVRKITPEQLARLDLSSWVLAGNGAEPVRRATLDAFARKFEPCGFRARSFCPAYGLAEATLKVTSVDRFDETTDVWVDGRALAEGRVIPAVPRTPGARVFVGCGRPSTGMQVRIVDHVTERLAASDRTGEIWVSGPSVASGYWNRPIESERVFGATIADTGEGPFLRSGDLGFLHEGELFVTGRLKDIVIIAGRNYHAEDIEATVADCHAALRPACCAAFSVDGDGEERLVLIAEIDRAWRHSASPSEAERTYDKDRLVQAIRQAIAEQHEIMASEILLVGPGRIPRTSSGKVQRHRCREAYGAGELDVDESAPEDAA